MPDGMKPQTWERERKMIWAKLLTLQERVEAVEKWLEHEVNTFLTLAEDKS